MSTLAANKMYFLAYSIRRKISRILESPRYVLVSSSGPLCVANTGVVGMIRILSSLRKNVFFLSLSDTEIVDIECKHNRKDCFCTHSHPFPKFSVIEIVHYQSFANEV